MLLLKEYKTNYAIMIDYKLYNKLLDLHRKLAKKEALKTISKEELEKLKIIRLAIDCIESCEIEDFVDGEK